MDALAADGRRPVFIVDDDPAKKGRQLARVTIRGGLEGISMEELQRYAVVVAIAENDIRKRIAQMLLQRGASLCGVRHPSALISPLATVDPLTQVLAGVIVNAGAVVQAHAVLNTGCIVEHDSFVGACAHIGPGAVLAGAVLVEEGAFVATGAKVCPFVRLGSWSTLGAGAVALKDLPPGAVAVGVPARTLPR